MSDSENPYRSPTETAEQEPVKPAGPSFGGHKILPLASLGLGFTFGFSLWWWSPALFGHEEPWDGVPGQYSTALFAAGFVATLLYPRNCVYAGVGLYFGQAFYAGFVYAPNGPQILPAFIAVAIFGVIPALFGGFTAMVFSALARRVMSRGS